MVKNDTIDLAIGPAYTQDLPTEVRFIEWKVFSRFYNGEKPSVEPKESDQLGGYKQSSAHLPRRDTSTTQTVERLFSNTLGS